MRTSAILWTLYHLNRQHTAITCRLVGPAQFPFTFGSFKRNKNIFGSRMHLSMCDEQCLQIVPKHLVNAAPKTLFIFAHANTQTQPIAIWEIRWDNLQSTILQTHSHSIHFRALESHCNAYKYEVIPMAVSDLCILCDTFVCHGCWWLHIVAGGASHNCEYTDRYVLPATPNSLAEHFASGVVKTHYELQPFSNGTANALNDNTK